MLNSFDYPFASEFYVIEKSIETQVNIRGESERVRIDALKRYQNYSTRAYIERHLVVQSAFPAASDHPAPATEVVRQWVDYDLPCTSRDSADSALAQALGFLQERCS